MFDSLISTIHEQTSQFTVYRSGEKTEFEKQFATHQVTISARQLPEGGPEPFLVIERDGEFGGILGLESANQLLRPPIVRPGAREDVSIGYRVLFEVLDSTVYTALSRRQLLAVSRELEDRAYRFGSGTLRAGFQALSTFKSQVAVYRSLANETDLDIHIYGTNDWNPPEIAGITYHTFENSSLELYWVLAFEGAADNSHPCGLVAREQEDGYTGFWTDDGTVVDEISTILREHDSGSSSKDHRIS